MQVVRAEAMGMCFGVKDAIAVAENLPSPQQVSIYGELVHNEHVNGALARAGFEITGEVGRQTPARPTVMVTAHGISNRERARLSAAGKQIVDTTCPLVRRAHDAAVKMAEQGWHVVIAGRRGHVEVLGLSGDLGACTIIQSPDEAQLIPAQRIAIICQTTLRPQDAQAIYGAMAQANPNAEVRLVNTICRPTRERQDAMMRLLDECDAVVVIGGAESNNTRQLVRLAEQVGRPVRHVQEASQLDESWAAQFGVMGVTAGTSTPDAIIEAVCRRLAAIPVAKHALANNMKEASLL